MGDIMIYLDYAANSPTDKRVLDLYNEITIKYFANPNSTHKLGLEAKKIIDVSTKNIAKKLGVKPNEIIYTSGATESNNLAIRGICSKYKNFGKHIIISSLEHSSVIAPVNYLQNEGFEVDLLSPKSDGKVDVNELKNLIREDTILVSITSVDSELGIKQPIEEIGELLSNYNNIFFHTDASQAIGKIKIDFSNVDLVTIAPHKFYGLNGFGALIKKSNIVLKPIILGGKSTTVYRSGTPVTANVVALDLALQLALDNLEERLNYVKQLNQEIRNFLSNYELININSTENSIPYTINFSIKGILSDDFVEKLSNNNVYISTKASCCPEKTPSKIVYALTNDKSLAKSSLRISISHLTTRDELNEFYKIFDKCYGEINGKI